MPTGEYCTHCREPQFYPGYHVISHDVTTWPAPAASPAHASPPAGVDDAPCALCLRLLALPKPASVASNLFSGPKLRLDGAPDIRTDRVRVPRDMLGAGRMGLARRVMQIVREDEERLCRGELDGMEPRGQAAEPPDMAALLEILEGANAVRPPGWRLDTVLLNPQSLARLACGDGDACAGGWSARPHGSVPVDTAYAVSSATGPALLRGPTVIECRREEFCVRHFCVADSGSGGVRVGLPSGAARA